MSSPTPSSRSTGLDRKSTRLNSSHTVISYAVFCLKKKIGDDDQEAEAGVDDRENKHPDDDRAQQDRQRPHERAGQRLPHFFVNDTATTEIYTLSLHDALLIFSTGNGLAYGYDPLEFLRAVLPHIDHVQDRKSTRLNSSHTVISYAVFCLKKKKKTKDQKLFKHNIKLSQNTN